MSIELWEDNAGGLHITDGATVWSGFEYLGEQEALTDILSAAAGDLALEQGTLAVAQHSLFHFDHPEIQLVAEYRIASHPLDASIAIYPFRCGKAARRYLGLPSDS